MAFADFTYPEVVRQFGLTWQSTEGLFEHVVPSQVPANLRDSLAAGSRLATTVNTEKARSEWLVAPLLIEFWQRYHGQMSLFSGVDFQADPAAKLTGFCDFLICRSPQQPQIVAPVMLIFEAKKENINDGLGQCIAGMVGAQRFNQRNGSPIDPIYGCVTTGSLWKFLQLSGTTLIFDLSEYLLSQADKLLGILTHIVGPPPAAPAAA